MNYTIITTYPETGSKNIGDQLITNSLKKVLSENQQNAKIRTVFRADNWENVKDVINNSDHILFACLAIRANMLEIEYPFIINILQSNIPFSVIAAGTQISRQELNISFRNFPEKTIQALRVIDQKATFFSTRGVLTQYFCEQIGLTSTKMSGDIAFSMYSNPDFKSGKKIKRIAISDPHNPAMYVNSVAVLYQGLKQTYPNASIEFFLHGINPTIKELCEKNNIKYREIFLDKNNGLDSYDNIDLHVGFRVHGHVTALSKGIYSYLLEQDGRGVEYGLTMNAKVSVTDIREPLIVEMSGVNKGVTDQSGASAHYLLSMIRQDDLNKFEKFLCMKDQIKQFINLNRKAIKTIS